MKTSTETQCLEHQFIHPGPALLQSRILPLTLQAERAMDYPVHLRDHDSHKHDRELGRGKSVSAQTKSKVGLGPPTSITRG
jgi:hypothetical protein